VCELSFSRESSSGWPGKTSGWCKRSLAIAA
jgi:hypothetical protein